MCQKYRVACALDIRASGWHDYGMALTTTWGYEPNSDPVVIAVEQNGVKGMVKGVRSGTVHHVDR